MLEFPEDLGEALLGTPASAWQVERLKKTAMKGMVRGGIFQCEWADVNYQKPTGLLSNVPELAQHKGFYEGWPTFIQGTLTGGRPSPRVYNGPLPRYCKHNGHEGLIGKAANGAFKTAPTGAYPPELCGKLADCCLKDFSRRMSSKADAIAPGGGEQAEVRPAISTVQQLWEHHDDCISVSKPLPEETLAKLVEAAKRCSLLGGSAAVGASTCLGLTSKGGTPTITDPKGADTLALPTLNTALQEALAGAGAHHIWSTLKICSGTKSEWHVDEGVIGPVAILNLTGAGAELQVEGGKPIAVQAGSCY